MKRLQVLLHQTLSFLFFLCLSEDLERPAAAGQLTNNSKASGASEMLPSIATSAVTSGYLCHSLYEKPLRSLRALLRLEAQLVSPAYAAYPCQRARAACIRRLAAANTIMEITAVF